MDRKSVIVLVVSFALILLWPKMMNQLYPPPPKSTNLVTTATNQLATTNISAPTIAAVGTNAAAIPQIEKDAPEKLLVVTNDNALYTFTSHGGALKFIELRKYPQTIDCEKTNAGPQLMASLNRHAPAPILALTDGSVAEKGSFNLTRSGDTVRAERTLASGLVEIKEFQISSNYLLSAKVRLENRSAQTIVVPGHELVVGTATAVRTNDAPMTLGAFWFNGEKAVHVDEGWFANKTLGCIPGTPREEFSGGTSNVVWAAVHNQFFTLAVIPKEAAPKMVSRLVVLPAPTNSITTLAPLKAIQTSLAYPSLTLTANQGMERQYTIYAGPKEYNRLARIGDDLKNKLDLLMNFGFFGFFAKMLLLSMNGLHALGLTYGWAIVAITVIIKLLFWPLTNASTKSMKRMAALQPQMKAIADKYKDDPAKKNQKTMEFMKENKVSPLGGCLPMLLQIPVFFGFYTMLQSAIELRGASFLWACDLSQADTVAHIAGFPINPRPLLMGVTMLFQARLTPMSPGMDPMQQKIMKYMPLMFMFILYKMSAGLTLYWTVQNLLTIAQMKLTKTDPTIGQTKLVAPAKPKSVTPKKKK